LFVPFHIEIFLGEFTAQILLCSRLVILVVSCAVFVKPLHHVTFVDLAVFLDPFFGPLFLVETITLRFHCCLHVSHNIALTVIVDPLHFFVCYYFIHATKFLTKSVERVF